VARRSWLLIAGVALVGVLAALAFPSAGSGLVSSELISLTSSGPSPSTLKMDAGRYLLFSNTDSVTHSVVFANGLCSLTVTPGERVGPASSVNGSQHPDCDDNFSFCVGSYAYTVDGKFPGTLETMPAYRAVTLRARTHRIRRGERLTLHGRAMWDNNATSLATQAAFQVIVLARYAGSHTLEPIATVAISPGDASGLWHLKVRPGIATTYIAELNGPEMPDLEAGRKSPVHRPDASLGSHPRLGQRSGMGPGALSRNHGWRGAAVG
jgi:plastocyanin